MRFWKATEKELGIIRKLDAEFGADVGRALAGREVIVNERREVFAITKDAHKTMKEMKRDPYGAGLLIGKIKKEKFDLGLEGASMIAAHAKKTVTVNRKDEQVILYGKDVVSKSAIEESGLREGERCLVANEHKENIAIGRIEKDRIINVKDKGHYLRSGR